MSEWGTPKRRIGAISGSKRQALPLSRCLFESAPGEFQTSPANHKRHFYSFLSFLSQATYDYEHLIRLEEYTTRK